MHENRTTILVTGASGFVGRPLVAALARSGYAVRAATRNKPASFPANVKHVVVPDFTKPVDWDAMVRGAEIVIHAAGLAHADTSEIPEAHFDRVNRSTTQELCDAAARAGVTRLLFISSVRAQVGPSAPHPLRETDEPRPTDAYGRSKLAAEAAVRASGVPFTILRPVVIYGRNARANFRALVRLASLPLPLPFAGLTNRRSLLGVDNLISVVLFTLANPATADETFLVADPRPATIEEIFTMLRHAQGRRPGLIHVPPNVIRLGLTAVGCGPLWQRVGGELVVDTGKLEAAGWHAPVDTYRGLAESLPQRRTPAIPQVAG
ncbi:MAG TPA: NAD-dependent epimerase/dehydratase family protein [Polyangia bacterium]|nr:NAD-dependent epimerase/dehydratase family protein [Polyangia bacterium]